MRYSSTALYSINHDPQCVLVLVTVQLYASTAALLGNLLRQKNSVNVGKNTSRCNGHSTKKLVQLLIILHCQCKVPWHDTSLLVITGGIASKL
mmetsp:Transcript_13920/g.20591  ORF Transcript_13920/g.20591 Transcript_13920/m.20591 type:complete len:93 (+) Transcript_13920:912-1190(+)